MYLGLRIFIFIEIFLKLIILILKSKLDRKYLIINDAQQTKLKISSKWIKLNISLVLLIFFNCVWALQLVLKITVIWNG